MPFHLPAEERLYIRRAELVAESDLVVRATVVDVTSRWNEDHSQIISLTTLRVSEVVKGDNVESELVLRQLGANQVAGLSSSAVAALNAGQLAALTATQIAALSATGVGGLTSTEIAGLTSTQMAALSSLQIGQLSNAALAGLSTTQVAALGMTLVRLYLDEFATRPVAGVDVPFEVDLVDLEDPQGSTILQWISRTDPQSPLIDQKVIDEEYTAFLAWIDATATCGLSIPRSSMA